MHADEQAIRDVVAQWISASKAGDTQTVLGLMDDGVVFLQPGRAPMRGKSAFAAAAAAQSKDPAFKIDGNSEIQEVRVFGDWAYLWTQLAITVTPGAGAAPIERRGHTLSILRKREGKWVIFRDANMLANASE
jgi:uncharacterized protein (TIGR02246 family)